VANDKIKCAILGSGNIGTDLMIKIREGSKTLEVAAVAGIDPDSPGLARARGWKIATTAEGIDGLVALPGFNDIQIVFDATSAGAHLKHDEILRAHGKQVVDLTPAAIGPYVVPEVNLQDNLDAANVNMVTCGGQATIPIVAAVNRVSPVSWGEIVASISSRSAGPGTRSNIDEFTQTTSRAIEVIGGAERGKAIIILNPAEPPVIMRNTVYCLCEDADPEAVKASVADMVRTVQAYVPGYRMKQELQIERIGDNNALHIPENDGRPFKGLKVTAFLEVEGAGDFLPKYAGNLDIMTAAAVKTGENIARLRGWAEAWS